MNNGRELLKPPSPDTRCELGVIITAVLGSSPRQSVQQVQRLQQLLGKTAYGVPRSHKLCLFRVGEIVCLFVCLFVCLCVGVVSF